jgi:hypothetical protein
MVKSFRVVTPSLSSTVSSNLSLDRDDDRNDFPLKEDLLLLIDSLVALAVHESSAAAKLEVVEATDAALDGELKLPYDVAAFDIVPALNISIELFNAFTRSSPRISTAESSIS